MRRVFLGVTAILIFLFGITAVSQATGKTNLILIFDTSGSMWGQIDGKAKITIAKEAMDLIVNDLPEDINIGLVAYGHRRKGDCDDVETLIPIGPLDAKAFMTKINALSPKGKTPMLRSIRKTAEAIKHMEDETTILLVSDGEETCDPDPCNFVAELEKLGIKFVLHVVGFDVGGQTEAQLKCMAKAGGGEYFPAKDADKLKDALNEVIEKTVSKNLKVSVFLNGKAIGADVKVSDPSSGTVVASRAASEKKPLMLSVTPGTYTVTVTDEWEQEGRPRLVFENVEITDRKVREITANFGSGILTIWNLKNGKPFKGSVKVTTMDGKTVGGGLKTTYEEKPAEYKLQPGKYQITAQDSWGTEAKIDLGTIEISAGQTIEKKASFDAGKIVVWIYKNGKPAHARVKIVDANGNGSWETTYEDGPATINKVPGTYQLIAEDSWGSEVRKDGGTVTLSGGQEIEKKISIDTGELTVWTYRNGKPFHGSVIVKDMNGKTMGGGWGTTYEDRSADYTLMPGTYKVSAEDSWGDPVVKYKFGEVEIKAGETLKKICDFDSPPSQTEGGPKPSTQSATTPKVESSTTAAAAQTAEETASRQGAPVDQQATAAQMAAGAQAQAAAAKTDAMAQMQAAMAQMQGMQLPQTSGAGQGETQETSDAGQAAVQENPKYTALPKVADSQAGYGAKIVTADDAGAKPQEQVGASPSTVDYSNVGAQDTGGGLTPENERPEQGHNPYEGMSTEQMQAAFAKDMGMQGPQGTAYDKTKWQLSAKGWPLQCIRHEDTLKNRLKTYKRQAKSMGRSDIIPRIDKANTNLKKLAKLRKKRAPVETVQQALDQCVQEVHAINVTIAQVQ